MRGETERVFEMICASSSRLDADLVELLPAARRPATAADRGLYTRLALASSLSRAQREARPLFRSGHRSVKQRLAAPTAVGC